jgi:predicted amidohydrolase YtcJ
MPIPDSQDGGTRVDRRTVLRTGLASAGTIAAGTLAGGTRAMAQEAADPENPAEMPPSGGAEDVTVGPDGVVFASETPPGPITIFVARQIVTMNPSNPEATHVAVRDGRILGAGTLNEVAGWGDYTLDETFQDHVLVPGLIEAHAHSTEGSAGLLPYVGYFDRPAPDGSTLPGIQAIPDLIAFLKDLDSQMTDPDATLVGIGFDPIYFPAPRLSATELDAVSTTRPIFLLHASIHTATVNTAMLEQSGINAQTEVTGVVKDADGTPNGELQEIPAMSLAASGFAVIVAAMSGDQTIWNLGALARNAGVTSVGDMGGGVLLDPSTLEMWQRIVNDPAFPARVTIYNVPASPGMETDWSAAAATVRDLQDTAGSEKLRFPGVKFIVDGSIQAWTAVMNWPGYYTGEDQGILWIAPEQFLEQLRPFHEAGINIHAHLNGDATIDLFINAVEQLLIEHPWLDHRHTVQHSQLTNSAQFRRMAKLGICANNFANHIWYWGDQHYELTVGPERANRMEASGTAKREGVHFSLHSDANVTPLGQLHTMWCAVNRVTPKGRLLGEFEKISAYDALYAVTVDAAYQMHLDAELGSIECGKWADFAVLEESPLDIEPMAIKDIPVWGTVVGGIKYEAAHPKA